MAVQCEQRDHAGLGGGAAADDHCVAAMGEAEDARRLYERALAIDEEALGTEHPNLAGVAINLGNVAESQGDSATALEHYRRGLKIAEKGLGDEHADTKLLRDAVNRLSG